MRHFARLSAACFSRTLYVARTLRALSYSLLLAGDGLFILFADLTPETHRYDCAEAMTFAYHQPDALLLFVFARFQCGWLFGGMANNLPPVQIQWCGKTTLLLMIFTQWWKAGALAGVLRKQEHELINVRTQIPHRTVFHDAQREEYHLV